MYKTQTKEKHAKSSLTHEQLQSENSKEDETKPNQEHWVNHIFDAHSKCTDDDLKPGQGIDSFKCPEYSQCPDGGIVAQLRDH